MIKLNSRLARCADSVSGCCVIDVGTDHGYLPCFLVESGTCRSAFACDIAEGPLFAAKKHIEELGLADRVFAVLSDGLKSLPEAANAATDIVIAGMGGEMIIKILADGGEFSKSRRLILQANTRVSALRRWLFENGFDIPNESAVRDGRFIYTVICAEFSGDRRTPSELECITGKLCPDVPIDKEYLEAEIARLESAAEGKKSSDNPKNKAEGERTTALAAAIKKFIGQ